VLKAENVDSGLPNSSFSFRQVENLFMITAKRVVRLPQVHTLPNHLADY
jgi:hypothetical protein